jgi:hypothetical protein
VVCFLRKKEGVDDAASALEGLPDMQDAFANTIRTALEYHVAMARRQDADIARLKKELISVDDTDVKSLVVAIGEKNWKKASFLEARSLLRLVAA